MILFYAIGLHEAGGLSILDFFIKSLPKDDNFKFYLDNRYKYDQIINKKIKYNILKNDLFSRILHEFKISKQKKNK